MQMSDLQFLVNSEESPRACKKLELNGEHSTRCRVTESLGRTPETNGTMCQLYFHEGRGSEIRAVNQISLLYLSS